MHMSVENKVGMDFIGNNKYIITETDIGKFLQL